MPIKVSDCDYVRATEEIATRLDGASAEHATDGLMIGLRGARNDNFDEYDTLF